MVIQKNFEITEKNVIFVRLNYTVLRTLGADT